MKHLIKLFSMIAVVMLVAMLLPATPAMTCNPIRGSHPIIFVHGGSGSATQFESQAMRFESNGYPHEYIYAYEYDSSIATSTMPAIWAGLDALIAKVKTETGAAQVDILGHSLGTTVMIGPNGTDGYLQSSPARAANVAHYVNIDGRTAPALPGGVPTLAIWAERSQLPPPNPVRTIVGATNVIIPNQTHVQSATSAESFVYMYQFFTGKEPATSDILPELPALVMLAGRAVFFPQNVGLPDATLEIWRVNGDTGYRIGKKPEKVYHISGDGAWGPFMSHGGWYYEFVLYRAGALPQHFYGEPYMRSDYLIRLQTSDALIAYMDKSDHTTDMNILRDKEIWGDQDGQNDSLEINGVEVVCSTPPFPNPFAISKLVIGVFVFDQGALLPSPYFSDGVPDGVSRLCVPILPFYLQTFLTGVDLVIPGHTPPDSTIPIVLTPRGGGGKTQVINVPNWASSGDAVSLRFHDYLQDINSWDDYVRYLLYLLFQKWF